MTAELIAPAAVTALLSQVTARSWEASPACWPEPTFEIMKTLQLSVVSDSLKAYEAVPRHQALHD